MAADAAKGGYTTSTPPVAVTTENGNYSGPKAKKLDEISRQGSLSLFRDFDLEDLVKEANISEPKYFSKNLDVPVVIVTSEISPWSKSGGLALVTASLALELAGRGHRTMAISPMYDDFEQCTYIASKKLWLFGWEHEVKYFHQWVPVSEDGTRGVDYVFVDHPCYHRPGGLYYNAQEGVEYADNLFRFALFTLASLEAPCCVAPGGAAYGEKVCFVANDWQSALLPVYLVHQMRPIGRFTESRCIFIVHNFGYQGIYPCNKLVPNPEGTLPLIMKNVDIDDFGLNGTGAYDHMIYQYPPENRSYDGDDGNVWNLTKGAVMSCDRLLTVSEGYAGEMKTAEGGFSLEALVQQKEFFLSGILNGIDVVTWDPTTDPHLAMNYDLNSMETGKATCKKQLQEKVGLKVDDSVVLVSFVGRLTMQKGIDIILESIQWMMEDTGNKVTGHIQVLLMGNGDEVHVRSMREIAQRYPGRVAGISFDPAVEHIMYAGSDLLVMPSRYEPCGLPQMCAQRYGTVPVVTLCGGLKDSVIVEPSDEATGFGILPLSSDKFKEIMYKACDTYLHDREAFQKMQRKGFVTDFSWCVRIDEYEKNIDWALADPPYVR
mmetsp:Transcript_55076/g.98255  ORF Transcript_55076/g.98255 Transcript_55076/m.98255 type:complete len:603 (-) Transcript_55076:71-1879(-)|eukprot:CAMPEP_0197623888 /NCGR_PEP_ID=MMETSP1338-20131121/3774_1 /TAXON_ID=43686 ORGANISM="Pelagodinium beii, Strain RCC1491" /NCGR_SAMPLE_ID=MMETSP1338 /ASSEMBLY_ACC=CAM_ASM_000754 /LENGTH=602 /DNA_ID=CAMNT_0043193975 /DNA_START=41 /DNA_END=1849 /DNA_ORIENTATION=+